MADWFVVDLVHESFIVIQQALTLLYIFFVSLAILRCDGTNIARDDYIIIFL